MIPCRLFFFYYFIIYLVIDETKINEIVKSIEEAKNEIVKTAAAIEGAKKEPFLAISTASFTSVTNLLLSMQIRVVVKKNQEVPIRVSAEFSQFKWAEGSDENAQTPAAVEHLQRELISFGVSFGVDSYQICDVHGLRNLLSVDDERTGKFSGGTDAVICPHGIAEECLAGSACVAIELKTEKNVAKNGLSSFTPQATLELICANYLSDQLTLVIVTDLSTGAYAWTLERKENAINIVKYVDLSLEAMASLIADHLEKNCIADVWYRLKRAVDDETLSQKEAVQIQRAFKKARVSNSDLALEHFHELLDETAPASQERAQVIREFMWSKGFPISDNSHLYV